MAKQNRYRCELDGFQYPENDLIIEKETGLLVCKNCLKLIKELDQEQEDIELMRAERKMKAGIY